MAVKRSSIESTEACQLEVKTTLEAHRQIYLTFTSSPSITTPRVTYSDPPDINLDFPYVVLLFCISLRWNGRSYARRV